MIYTDPTSASTTSSAGTDVQSRMPVKTLGQEDFLKLLVTQMTSQDPMNPQKDTDFIAQMAQFSSLEQAQTMQSDLSQLQGGQQFSQATGLLGQTVDLQQDANTVVEGVVTAMKIDGGVPKIVVNNQTYTLNQVLSVTPTPMPTLSPTSPPTPIHVTQP